MSDRGHKRSDGKGKFCTAPCTKNCDECPGPAKGANNYRKVCKPAKWGKYTLTKLKDGVPTPYGYEAHHIVCVSPTTTILLEGSKIGKTVEQTEWCINQKKNMVALPLWGHTVQWYCQIDEDGGKIRARRKAPDFANRPQHDIDHNSEDGYTSEVKLELVKLAKQVAAKAHEVEGQNLAKKLDDLSDKFRQDLADRGRRPTSKGKGTHAGWQAAQKETPDPKWCHPFSMASDTKVQDVAFPAKNFNDKLTAWIDRLASAIGGT
jgi:A nuclease family of the HNH/ENDO VII superfamily with conserved AHH